MHLAFVEVQGSGSIPRGRSRQRRSVDVQAVLSTSATDVSRTRSPQRSGTRPSLLPSTESIWATQALVKQRINGFWQSLSARMQQYAPLSGTQLTALMRPTVLLSRAQTPTAEPAVTPDPSPDQQQPERLLEPFLRAADEIEIAYAAMLADLSNVAYDVSQIDGQRLEQHHHLELVTTSSCHPISPMTRDEWHALRSARQREPSPPPPAPRYEDLAEQHHVEQHDSAVSPSTALENPQQLLCLIESSRVLCPSPSPALTPSSSNVALSSMEELAFGASSIENAPRYLESFGYAVASSDDVDEEQQQRAHQQQEAAAAIAFREGPSPQAASLAEPAGPLQPSPSAWFVADDHETRVRYFAIQGSTNFDHWQINLQFEPVIFEDPALGVRVHRGVYEAALHLYDELLPLVQQHLRTSPFASCCFTGHSLGGSLAVVLALLFVQRGVLPRAALSPCYTFGAPAVFCGGAPSHEDEPPAGAAHGPGHTSCEGCQLPCVEHAAEAQVHPSVAPFVDDSNPADGAKRDCVAQPKGLLERLGLTGEHVVNVMMHKDIVPRAFVCDYTMVADLLKRWMPSFQDHSTLAPGRSHKSLYNFVGVVAVLRPSDKAAFVSGDGQHPMMVDTPGLYKLRPVPQPLQVYGLDGSHSEIDHKGNIRHLGTFDAVPSPLLAASPATPRAQQQQMRQAKHPVLRTALLQFMNHPHPLATLSEYSAYGPNGSISRYHNPFNYFDGLQGLVHIGPAADGAGSADN